MDFSPPDIHGLACKKKTLWILQNQLDGKINVSYKYFHKSPFNFISFISIIHEIIIL